MFIGDISIVFLQLMGFINQFITRGTPPCTHETTDHIQFWTLEVLSAGRWPMRKRISGATLSWEPHVANGDTTEDQNYSI